MLQDTITPKTRQNANRRRRNFTRLQIVTPEPLALRLPTHLLRRQRGFSLRSVVLPVMEDTTTPKTRQNANRRRRNFTRLQIVTPEPLALRLAARLLRRQRGFSLRSVVLPVMLQDTITPKTRQNANRRRRNFTRLQIVTPEPLALRLPTHLLRRQRGFSLRSVVLPVMEDTTTPKTRQNANRRRRNFTRLQIVTPEPLALRLAARLLRRQRGFSLRSVVLPVMLQDTITPKTRHYANRRRRNFTRLQIVTPEPLALRLPTHLLRRQRGFSLRSVVLPVMEDTTTPKTRQNANRRRRNFTRLQIVTPEPLVLRLATRLLRRQRGSLPQTLVLPVMEDTTTPKTRQNAKRRRRTTTRLQIVTPEPLVLRLRTHLLRRQRGSLPDACFTCDGGHDNTQDPTKCESTAANFYSPANSNTRTSCPAPVDSTSTSTTGLSSTVGCFTCDVRFCTTPWQIHVRFPMGHVCG